MSGTPPSLSGAFFLLQCAMAERLSSSTRNIKMLLEYDGTGFVGWQVQAQGRSVQGELERTLKQLLQENVNVVGSGRTDAGVHARGQVANFRTTREWTVTEIHRALSATIPEDIVVRAAEEVPLDFHSRYSAIERRYQYFISTAKRAVKRQYCWHVPYTLDFAAMNQASELVQGQHDFEAFSKADSGTSSFVCTVNSAGWRNEGSYLIFQIRADHYVRGMVRALVGTMVDVGRGYRTVDQFNAILSSKDRSKVGSAAPARGLFLEEVRY
jgi:tRNA pseudouridine38-40 synthase